MQILEFIKIIFIGIVQGVTEWLPISSTGHMILVDEIINLNISEKFKSLFFVVIQFGSILAVILIYFNKLNPIDNKKTNSQKIETINLWKKVLIATVPAAIIGLLFDDKINQLFYNYKTVATMLIIYGIAFILIENKNKKKKPKINAFKELNYGTAILIGVFQILALIPGTSRSGATILGAIIIGCSRKIAAEFSFFMAIPVMLGASSMKILKFGFNFSQQEIIILLTAMIIAFLTSIIAIKFLLNYIKKKDFSLFGYYRIILSIIVFIFFSL